MPAFTRSLLCASFAAAALAGLTHERVCANSGRHDQDRRPERLLRSVRRPGRQGIAGRRSTGGRGLRQRGRRPQGRDRLRRSSEQARHRGRDRAAMGGRGGRRRDRRPRQFRRRSRRQHAHAREEPRDARLRDRDLRPDRKILSADHRPMGSRHLGARFGDRPHDHQNGRVDLVLHQLRLRARQGVAARRDRGDPKGGRLGASARSRIRSARPISAPICCRRKHRAPK